jgi:membrane associated rhomboid family serine protease
MADRISARRGLANTFFLTLNSGIFTVIGAVWTSEVHAAAWLLIFPVLGTDWAVSGLVLACPLLQAT